VKVIAKFLGTIVVVIASDISMNAANIRVAGIGRANCAVVAICGDIEGKAGTSGNWITIVVSALIAKVAVVEGMNAEACVHIARVVRASIIIITVQGSLIAQAVCDIAFELEAIDGGTSNIDGISALIAIDRSVHATRIYVAGILEARVSQIAVQRRELTSQAGIARSSMASIRSSAGNGRELATLNWVTELLSAQIVVLADVRCMEAGVTTSRVTSIISTHIVVIARGGTDASTSTRAETLATCSTWSSGNIDASGDHKTGKNLV
jgi:hypothetical protein